jgi:hypothetical protein
VDRLPVSRASHASDAAVRRSGTGRGPGALAGHGGSNGTINSHSSSSMTHALLLANGTRLIFTSSR